MIQWLTQDDSFHLLDKSVFLNQSLEWMINESLKIDSFHYWLILKDEQNPISDFKYPILGIWLIFDSPP